LEYRENYSEILNSIDVYLGVGIAILRLESLEIEFENQQFKEWVAGSSALIESRIENIKVERLRKNISKGQPYSMNASLDLGSRKKELKISFIGVSTDSEIALVHISDDTKTKELEFMLDSYSKMAEKKSKDLEKIKISLEDQVVERTKKLKDSLDQLKLQSTAMESAANGIMICSSDGKIEWVNSAFCKLTEYTFHEAVGQYPSILKSGKHDVNYYKDLWAHVLTGKVWHEEVINQKKSGTLYHEEQTITPVFNDQGKVTQFVAIKQDITDRKLLEQKIEDSNLRMSTELNVAKDIQKSMLPLIFPAYPKRKEIDIYANLIPAREVGGDFYDFHFIDNERLCFVVGDVSGKGVPAALMMAVCKTLLKSRATNDFSTASILTHTNNEMARENINYMFVTVFIAILNTSTGELVYSNAGHNPTFIKHKSKEITKLTTLHGPVVAAMEGISYKETRITLDPGDMIFAYTDGVTEAHNKKDELFSDKRLIDFISTHDFISAKGTVDEVISEVRKFESGYEQYDDITALCIEFYGQDDSSMVREVLNLKSNLDEIQFAIEKFEKFATKHNLEMAFVMKMSIVLDELLANTIKYAFDDAEEHFIHLEFKHFKKKFVMIIEDGGVPFNPFTQEDPDTKLSVEERSIGGLGIHIVKSIMDEFTYDRKIKKNILTLTKFFN
jgi:sigma-B regulation protein RsbU (phosphoserine phosphatase)